MLNFCTLFDSYYLNRGIALYDSLCEHNPDFHLYIFAFDDVSYNVLLELALPKTTIVALKELEHWFANYNLESIRQERSWREYCWTCTPFSISYVIEKHKVDHCTYLDSDIYFFANPQILIEEMGNKSVLITEHRYSPKYDMTEFSGHFCVQFMVFKNTNDGLEVLNWWRDACAEWCYMRSEEGKFGDQKYLNHWPTKYEKAVHVLQHLGGGCAPWNVQQYLFFEDGKKILCKELSTSVVFELVFYHFHNVKYFANGKVDFGVNRLSKALINLAYRRYIFHLHNIGCKVQLVNYSYNNALSYSHDDSGDLLNIFKRILKKTYNVYNERSLVKL